MNAPSACPLRFPGAVRILLGGMFGILFAASSLSAPVSPEDAKDAVKQLNANWMPAKDPPPVDGYRIETCIWPGNGWVGHSEFNGYDHPEGISIVRGVIDFLSSEYGAGHVGLDMPYVSGEVGKELCEYARSKGVLPMSEMHNTPGPAFLDKVNGWVRDREGQSPRDVPAAKNSVTHGYDVTNPAVLQAVQEKYLPSAKAGAVTVRIVDYVWPWNGGGGRKWGYSDDAIKRWREDLNGTDAGLEIVDGKGFRIAKFMEYFASYHGYRPTLADAGLTSWDNFNPPMKDEPPSDGSTERSKIYSLLFHYEWLKFAYQAAGPSAALGMTSQPICNPESFDNGTDLAWLLRLRNLRGVADEWWGSALIVIPNYYAGGYYDSIARANHKELVLWGESSAAGGNPFRGPSGHTYYCDNMANYLVNYSQGSSLDFKAKQDQYWGSSVATMTNPNRREYQAWTAFRSAFDGFLQGKNDKARKPKADLLAIESRSVPYNISGFDTGRGNQPYDLTKYLIQQNYLSDSTAAPFDQAQAFDSYRTILWTTFEPPQGLAQRMADWLNAGVGRTLITHSFIPARHSVPAGQGPQGPSPVVQEGGQEKILGFGKIVQGSQTDGVLNVLDPSMKKALEAYDGKTISLQQGLYETEGGKPLVTLGGKPLVSERTFGQGRILYLHFLPLIKQEKTDAAPLIATDPASQDGRFETAVMNAVLAYAGHRPQALAPEGIHVLRYDMPGGSSVCMTINDHARSYVNVGGDVFRCYQAQDPGVTGTAEVLVGKASAPYELTDMITGAKSEATSDSDGYLPVDYTGWNLRGVYLQPK